MDEEFDSGLDVADAMSDCPEDSSFDVGSVMDDAGDFSDMGEMSEFESMDDDSFDVSAIMDEAEIPGDSDMFEDFSEEPEITGEIPEEIPAEPEMTEEIPEEEFIPEEIPAEPEMVEEIPEEEFAPEEIPTEPEMTEEIPEEEIIPEEIPAEPEMTEEIPEEEITPEEIPTEPEMTEEIPEEEFTPEEIPAEPEMAEEVPEEEFTPEEIPAEPEMVEEIPEEEFTPEEIPAEPEMAEEVPEEEFIPEEIPTEPEMTEEIPEEEFTPEEIPTEPEMVEEIPEKEFTPEEIPTEPEMVEEIPEEEFTPEEIPTEPEMAEEIPEEEFTPEEIPTEPEMVEEIPEEEFTPEEIPAEPEMVEEIPEKEFIPEEIPTEPEMTEEIPEEKPVSEDTGDATVAMGPGPAQTAMGEYLSEHNYGREDYGEYSKDPEWQRLNNDLLEELGREPIEYPDAFQDSLDGVESLRPEEISAETMPERMYDEFEESVRLEQEDFYDNGTFYTQGINEYGYSGTCGETSMASTINRVLGTNEYTENKVLDVAVQEGLCDTSSFSDSGGTTTEQFMELYDRMNETCGNQLDVELHDYDQVLSMEEAAQRLDEGCTLNVAVDSDTLWDIQDPMGSPFPETKATDHWITVTGVDRGQDGSILGFDIIDSGGGESYVDAEKYQAMCYGTDRLELTDPTCIVVSKKELPELPAQAAPSVDSEIRLPAAPVSGMDGPRVFAADGLYDDFSNCPEDSDEAFDLQRVIHQPANRRTGGDV